MSKEAIVNAIKDLIYGPEDELGKAYAVLKSALAAAATPKKSIKLLRTKVKRVTPVAKEKTTDVYDIGMKNETHPWFFANNMLVHNSVYFSAYPVLKKEIENGEITWDKETVVRLYDQVADQVNATFQDFMLKSFHCPKSRSDVIKAGREIVGVSGLFITKKRYSILVYDEENTRLDVDGKPGKVKAMGLDLRRSDTPEYMQDFLKEVLLMVLQEETEDKIVSSIREFRRKFNDMPPWEKGSPKRANNIQHYHSLEKKSGKANMPGHVRASINWNTLKRVNSDNYSLEIVDGMKVIVCKLKENPIGFTSVAYPVDELRLPEWFKELPFDTESMSETIIDNKIDNLIGVLNYDLSSTRVSNTFNDFFSFE